MPNTRMGLNSQEQKLTGLAADNMVKCTRQCIRLRKGASVPP
ncbi:MAG: hypothetical protein RR510_00840 [Morganella sp. (in: enterobacteria)]